MKEYATLHEKVYDALAAEYEENLAYYAESDKKLFTEFIKYLKTNFKNAAILELGPGSGLNLSYFEIEGFETTAIDISKNMINISKKVAPKAKYICGEFLDYDFGKVTYDGIVAKAFIHLFPKDDAVRVLEKIKSLLTPNGIAFITTTLHEQPEEGYFIKKDYKNKLRRFRKRWTEEELFSVLKGLDFEIVSKSYDKEIDKGKNWIILLARPYSLSSS